jgi:hypothetical protein
MKRSKNSILFILLIASLLTGCEVDDICTADIHTPRLSVGLYDTNNPNTYKEVDHLYVWAAGKDSIYKDKKTDKLLLPLDLNQTQTTYFLSVASVVDTLVIIHENNEVFVSRSCGYMYNFTLNASPTLTHNWTMSSETINTPQFIENEQDTHFKIYH